ncbi:MAG: phosphoenolpyruvate carboxylase, partial [Ilumatobacteraceae bacterium]
MSTTEPTGPVAAFLDDAGDDIRLLGHLIGEVLRDQAGHEAFELVESTRRLAVTARRDGRQPIHDLASLLGEAPIDQQVHLIRAFGWLSLLANTAEDLAQERRRRHHRDAGDVVVLPLLIVDGAVVALDPDEVLEGLAQEGSVLVRVVARRPVEGQHRQRRDAWVPPVHQLLVVLA